MRGGHLHLRQGRRYEDKDLVSCSAGGGGMDAHGAPADDYAHTHKDASAANFSPVKGLIQPSSPGVLSCSFQFPELKPAAAWVRNNNDAWMAAHPGEGSSSSAITWSLWWYSGADSPPTFIWCMILNARNRSIWWLYQCKITAAENYLLCALGGTTWFLQFFFMEWVKAGWAMAPTPGYYTCHSSSSWPICGYIVSKEWNGVTSQNQTYNYHRYTHHHRICIHNWVLVIQWNKKLFKIYTMSVKTTEFKHVSYLWDEAKLQPWPEMKWRYWSIALTYWAQIYATNYGGGNTSCKAMAKDPLTGEETEGMWVKAVVISVRWRKAGWLHCMLTACAV